MDELDLLKLVVDSEEKQVVVAAFEQLTEMARAKTLSRNVTLVKARLQIHQAPWNCSVEQRREKVREAIRMYGLDFQVWF